MKKYIHTRDNKIKPFSFLEEEKYFKYMESEGWELVNVINEQSLNIYPIIYYWKKEILS